MLAIVLIESDVTEHGITKIQSDVTIIAGAGRQNRDNPDNRQTGLRARLAISAIIVTGACGIARVSKKHGRVVSIRQHEDVRIHFGT
jgi:hypothetical protein